MPLPPSSGSHCPHSCARSQRLLSYVRAAIHVHRRCSRSEKNGFPKVARYDDAISLLCFGKCAFAHVRSPGPLQFQNRSSWCRIFASCPLAARHQQTARSPGSMYACLVPSSMRWRHGLSPPWDVRSLQVLQLPDLAVPLAPYGLFSRSSPEQRSQCGVRTSHLVVRNKRTYSKHYSPTKNGEGTIRPSSIVSIISTLATRQRRSG